MRTKLVKLSEAEYTMLMAAKKLVESKGLANLPPMPVDCPFCGTRLDGPHIGGQYSMCQCGYLQCQFIPDGALGAIVGIGSLALISLISPIHPKPEV